MKGKSLTFALQIHCASFKDLPHHVKVFKKFSIQIFEDCLKFYLNY